MVLRCLRVLVVVRVIVLGRHRWRGPDGSPLSPCSRCCPGYCAWPPSPPRCSGSVSASPRCSGERRESQCRCHVETRRNLALVCHSGYLHIHHSQVGLQIFLVREIPPLTRMCNQHHSVLQIGVFWL